MSLRPPSESDVRELGEDLHLDLSPEEVADFQELITDGLDAYRTVREYGQPSRETPIRRRSSGHRVREEDPFNAWITKCTIEGASEGPLSGVKVAIKDNVAVAGVEMTCGSQVMEGYVPNIDATIVTRILESGGTIVGKTNMDDMAFTGNGHSSAFGPTLNPHDSAYLAGGSSGGSAIAVAREEVALGIGGDQGGSIRVPAAWCGIVGHKPTHGLVPYTGIVGIENTIDHVGPLARSVPMVAKSLTVMAGKDPDDPRQPESLEVDDYQAALDLDISDVSIAVVEEGFDRPEHEAVVNEHVREGIEKLEGAGATVNDVSLPIHADAIDIYTVALAEGAVAAFRGEGVGHNWKGWYNTSWVDSFGKFRRSQGGDFPPSLKYTLLLGAYTAEEYHSSYYAQAMNQRAELTEAYNELLESHDIIAMPTAPQTPHKWVPDQNRFEFLDDAWGSLANTAPFNATGHPALSVPVEPDENGLGIGLMLVGRHFDDSVVLGVGNTLEKEMS